MLLHMDGLTRAYVRDLAGANDGTVFSEQVRLVLRREVLGGGWFNAREKRALGSSEGLSDFLDRVVGQPVRDYLKALPPGRLAQMKTAARHVQRYGSAPYRPAGRPALAGYFDELPTHRGTPLADPGAMTGSDFEHWCAQELRAAGWTCDVTKASGDQGVDVIATSPSGRRVAVQCKRYRGSVGNAAVQEVFTARAHIGATDAIVVTTGTYTRAAAELAGTTGVKLLRADDLARYARES